MHQQRFARAVLVSVEVTPNGSIISLDDVVRGNSPEIWKQADHYTRKDVAVDFLDLTEEELAVFGYSILARLSAFKIRGEL